MSQLSPTQVQDHTTTLFVDGKMCVHRSPDTLEGNRLHLCVAFMDSSPALHFSTSTQIHKCMLPLSAGGYLGYLCFQEIHV